MSPAEFIEAKRAVQQQTTDDLRIDFAKQIATNNCFTNQQVREMLSAFSFDDRRLEFAELAYDRSVDPRNYYRVAEALSFAANRKALLSYLNDNPVPVYEAPAPSYTPANPYPTPRGGYQPYVPNYTGRVGLNRPPLSETEFVNIRAALANQSFEDTRFSTAKQTLAARCVTVAQVVELTRLFQYESTRLDFAKFAYGRTFDIDNYYLVNDAFEFDSSRQALQEFVASRP